MAVKRLSWKTSTPLSSKLQWIVPNHETKNFIQIAKTRSRAEERNTSDWKEVQESEVEVESITNQRIVILADTAEKHPAKQHFGAG